MAENLVDALFEEVGKFLAPIRSAVEDPRVLGGLLAQIGATTESAGGDGLAKDLGSLVALANQLEQLSTQPSPSFAGIDAVMKTSRRAFAALRNLSKAGGPAEAVEGLGVDLADLLIQLYLWNWHRLTYKLGVLATVIRPASEDQAHEPVRHGDTVVRMPFQLDQVRLSRLGDLLRDPAGALRAEYGTSLATVADANAMADKLFPRVLHVLRELGVACRYGFDPADAPLLADSAPLVDHALIVYTSDPLLGAEIEAGVILTLSSADRGDLGLIVSPFGTLQAKWAAGSWDVELDFTADVQAFAYGRHGFTLLASPGTAEVTAKLAANLEPPASGPAFVIGSPTGSRLEVGGADLGFQTTLSEARQTFAASADVSRSAIVVSPGDGDGFLRSILPADGLVANFDLGLAWSNETGLAFRGSAGLDATLPVGVSIGGVLTIPTVHLGLLATETALIGEVSASVGLAIGPIQALVDRVGITSALTYGGDGAPSDWEFSFKPPSGVGLVVDAGPVVGGGFLTFDPQRGEYAGEMHLQFEEIAVRAIGLLTTHLPGGQPGFSLLVIVSAEFPPVQLGLGFMLVGVGGLLGINRTVAVEALRAGLKTGALGAVLSPPDPKASVASLVAVLAGLFPPAAGRHVFAPTARIVWGTPTLITIELCLVLELPAPVRLVALGRLRALLPDEREAIVRIQVDVLGVIDFDRAEAAVDATLVDSRLAQFALTGDMALRMSWGAQPSFLLAVGGFHPRFAAPPGFPALARVAIALASGDNPKLRLEAYLALTSNTVQFGARVDLAARAGSFSIAGFLSFDALVTLAPLAFVVDIAAKLAVKAGGHTLLSVSLALTLSGPHPWRAHGRASFSILFFDVSFGFDVTIGDDAAPVLPPPVDVAPLLLAAFADARSWSAQLPAGAAAVVTLRALEPGTAVLAHPLATPQVRQRVAPLERTLERFGTSAPSGANRFRITLATIGGVPTSLTPLQDEFAPAQFTALSDDAKLSAPSFQTMTSGAALGADGYATGAAVSVSVVYEQLLVTAPGVAEPSSERLAFPGDVFATLTATPLAPRPTFAVREVA